ncbi:response regulator transcription factor [Patescibacteria group bacterium]
MMRILLIEDDYDLAEITAKNLERQGFVVDVVNEGKVGIQQFEELHVYDIVVVDLGLPDIDGTEVLRSIKKNNQSIPVVALTGKDKEDERIKGIEIGFDDYVTKPFSNRELVARIRVLNRSRIKDESTSFSFGFIHLDPNSRNVYVKGDLVKFSSHEYNILLYLLDQYPKLVTLECILRNVWDRNMDKTIDKARVFTTISRVRKKLLPHHTIIRKDYGYTIK